MNVYRQQEDKYFVRSAVTGQRGWLVDAKNPDKPVTPPWPDKMTMVRLDRPAELVLKAYRGESEWKPERTASPLSEMAKAKISYVALQELANAMGDYEFGRKGIEKLNDVKRIAFLNNGPQGLDVTAKDDIRQKLHDAIMAVLG